ETTAGVARAAICAGVSGPCAAGEAACFWASAARDEPPPQAATPRRLTSRATQRALRRAALGKGCIRRAVSSRTRPFSLPHGSRQAQREAQPDMDHAERVWIAVEPEG